MAGTLGPAHLGRKLLAGTALAALAALWTVQGTYRVSAPAVLEGEVQRAIVAPYDGHVAAADVRAGDVVSAGDPIASLDDRDLRLERSKWVNERASHEAAYGEALAKRDTVQMGLSRKRMDQAGAEIARVDEQLARARLRAPFDGVVVAGDLSQSLGSPVQVGQVLFEIAPLDGYRVMLEVDEHDVARLGGGQTGHLLIAALPSTALEFRIDRIVPVAVADQGRNFFRVEARLTTREALLRPGMRGVAKVDLGQRRLLWIWTHSLLQRARLWAWSLGW